MARSRLTIGTALTIAAFTVAALVAGALFLAPASSTTAAVSELRMITEKGEERTLSGFRGKAVLLNVWATWCPPCREEMPSLDRLQRLKGGPDFEVVALSIDKDGANKVRPFFDEVGISSLQMYLDPSMTAMKTLGVVGLPTTLLIDAKGNELKRWVGPREWDVPEAVTEIEALLSPVGAAAP